MSERQVEVASVDGQAMIWSGEYWVEFRLGGLTSAEDLVKVHQMNVR